MSGEPAVSGGGLYLYRAIAECSACGKVVDVGPFDNLTNAVTSQLPGWLLTSGGTLTWRLADGFGTPVTLCDECMEKPLRVTLAAITEAARQ